MEEMSMHHVFEYGMLTLLFAKLLGEMIDSWGVNCSKHKYQLKSDVYKLFQHVNRLINNHASYDHEGIDLQFTNVTLQIKANFKLPSKTSCDHCNFYLRFVTQVENDQEIK